jgi:hypothetical protein
MWQTPKAKFGPNAYRGKSPGFFAQPVFRPYVDIQLAYRVYGVESEQTVFEWSSQRLQMQGQRSKSDSGCRSTDALFLRYHISVSVIARSLLGALSALEMTWVLAESFFCEAVDAVFIEPCSQEVTKSTHIVRECVAAVSAQSALLTRKHSGSPLG